MTGREDVVRAAADLAVEFARTIDARDAVPDPDAIAALSGFDESLPDAGADPVATIELLARVGGPAAMGSTGPRYFGFVNGATLPAALGAAFLTSAWDQNAALPVMSPVATKLYEVTRTWLLDLFELATETDVTFVTGATVANASCLAAARDALLADQGWDAPTRGLFGAPEVQVVVGAAAHSTLRKSLGVVGLGSERTIVVPADDQGRIVAEALPDLDPERGPILVCAQAGEVNTGAFDPFEAIADWATPRDAWLHVDGAFGLWALADPSRADLTRGLRRADSLATDGHKWLNVTYDCGIAFVQRAGALRRTFASVAGYLPPADSFEMMHHTPQSSQRARQIEVWAALRTLGRSGVAQQIRLACDSAATIADLLRSEPGFEILNDVVLNQVLVRFRDDESTAGLVEAVQRSGRIWCGPTTWSGGAAMRISVSSWKTTEVDAAEAAAEIIECSKRI